MQAVLTAAAAFLGVVSAYFGVVTYLGLVRADEVAADQYGQTSFSSTAHAGFQKTLTWDESTIFHGSIVRVILLAPGLRGPLPPGVSPDLKPGQTEVSPALRRLLNSPDGSLLAPRVPGRLVGTIVPAGLSSASDLRAYAVIPRPVVAQSRHLLPHSVDLSSARVVDSFSVSTPTQPAALLVLGIALIAAVLPVTALTATAVRFRSAQREARLAALWLLGCGQHELRVIETVRSATASTVGALIAVFATMGWRAAEGRLWPQRTAYTGAHGYPLLPILALVILTISVAGATTAAATRWHPDEAFATVRTEQVRRTISPRWWPTAAAAAIALAALYGVTKLLPQSIQPFLLAEYLAVLLLLISASVLMPELAVHLCQRALRPWGLAALLARHRVAALAPAAARSLSAISLLIIVAPALQALVALTDETQSEPVPGVTATQVVISAPRAAQPRLANVEGIQHVDVPTGSEGTGPCGPRFPCLYRVRTDGTQAAVERLRNALGWSGQVNSAADPPTSQLYGPSTPRKYAILRTTLLAALIAAELAVVLGLVDGVHSRVRANAALAAMGLRRSTARSSSVLELFIPSLFTAALSLALGIALQAQLASFLGQGLAIHLDQALGETALFLGGLLAVLALILPAVSKPAGIEHLRASP